MPPRRIRAEIRRRRPHVLIGCLVAGLCVAPAGALAKLTAASIAVAIAAFGLGRRGAITAIGLALLGSVFGAWRIEVIDRPASAAPPGSVIEATATLLERPHPGLFGSSAPMKIESGPARRLRILARSRESRWKADPGTRFRIRGLVRDPQRAASSGIATAGSTTAGSAPAGSATTGSAPIGSAPAGSAATGSIPSKANAGVPGTPGFGPLPPLPDPGGDFDFGAFLRSRGIGREVSVESLVPVGRRGGIAGVVDSIRRRAEAGIGAGLGPDQAALARGMVLGEDGDVADATRDDFRRSGLAHLLAASGQNIALLCALVLPLLILGGTTQAVRVAILLPLIATYVALAGSGASIARAGIMAAAGLFAIVAGRRSSATYALLLAAAVTLAHNPRAASDPGWQLSFAAVIGMLTLAGPIQRRLTRLPGPIAEALATTLAATVATAPLLAHEFGAVSIAALPANLAAFPVVAPIMWIGMIEAALEQVAALGQPIAALAHALEAVIAPLQSLGLSWVAGVATRFADPAWAQAHVRFSWLAAAATYACLGCVVVALGRLRLRAPGGRWLDWLRALSPASRRAYGAPVAALVLAAAAHAAATPAAPKQLTVDFIDVGQGDSTLIRDPTGAAMLFDGGVPEARVDRTLRRLGVRRLSIVVATHQSRDHHAGLLQVVRRFPVGLFLDGRDGVDDPSFIALEREVDRRRIPRRPVRAGEHLRAGAMSIHILWPPPRTPDTPPGDPNLRAAVAVVSEGAFSLLLSADAEAPVLLPLHLPRVDAMKVPHHGSAEDGLPQLLRRLQPTVAAIETGRGNRYGHPRPSTLQALRAVPRVYRTDRDGTIELTVTGNRIAIRTHR